MSRMLEALKQIDARSPQPTEEPVATVGDDSVSADSQSHPAEGVATDEAVEAALARAEAAAELAVAELCAAGASPEETAAGVSLQEGPAAEPPPAPQPVRPSQDRPSAYDNLAEKILAQLPADRPASLMFTSPADGDGKTSMLLPLARAIVEQVRGKVLLIDADFRRPDLASRLDADAPVGLADVLMGATTWQQVVRSTDVPRLEVLPGKRFSTPEGRPPEMLNLDPLLQELSDHYQFVLLDTSSLHHREVAPIARCCDAVYLVLRAGQTTRRAARQAARAIESCGGQLLGTVLLGC